MPSIVWGRDPQEAYEQPYEYEAQEQFAREAMALLGGFYRALNSNKHRYSFEDRSAEKAKWLLAMDALDSLRDSLASLSRKDHRLAGKLFRDVMETMDLAAYVSESPEKNKKALARWYNNEFVAHHEYRDRFKQLHGDPAAKLLADRYRQLSRLTHRSYSAVLDGYTLGVKSRLVHDRTDETYSERHLSSLMLVPPQTIAAYYAYLAACIVEFAERLIVLRLVDSDEVKRAFGSSLKVETMSRRFVPRRWLLAQAIANRSSDEID